MAAIISSAEQALCKHQSAGNLRWMWPLGSVIMRRFFAQIYVLCCNCLSPAAAARSSTLSCKSIYFACQRDHLSMTLACRLLPLLLVPTMAGAAEAPPLLFIAPTNHSMPMARFQNGELTGGLLWDLGELIARRMGRRAVFVSIPSRRVSDALSDGHADAVCYVLP